MWHSDLSVAPPASLRLEMKSRGFSTCCLFLADLIHNHVQLELRHPGSDMMMDDGILGMPDVPGNDTANLIINIFRHDPQGHAFRLNT